ncbi:BTAD domain-containing putative transcriptional regulator [Nocardia sp. NPDC046473]|uniref:AfsR/SARP family transcriptional regulator n=1 Tax=Nocardia sp. NPDC046473 TaxID=3155733 RepID=UPI0033D74DAF
MANEMVKLPPGTVRFQLLGPVEARVSSTRVELGTPRERRLLVALLSSPGRRVPRDNLAHWVWDDPPDNAARKLDEPVSDLRRHHLSELGLADRLISKDGWCQFDIPADCVDVHLLRKLVDRATQFEDSRRRELLIEAMQLRHGEPLEDLDGSKISAYRDKLAADYRHAEILFNQFDVRNGRERDRLTDLERLYHARPQETRVAGLYICALHYGGLPVEALDVFQHHRKFLDKYGMAIPKQLTNLHERLLSGEDNISPQSDVFLGGQHISEQAQHEASVDEEDSNAKTPRQNATNIVNNTLTGDTRADYMVFGFDNRSS